MIIKCVDNTPIVDLKNNSEKKIIVCCDICHKYTTTIYSNYYKSQIKYKRKGKTYCRSCSNKINGINKKGKKINRVKKGKRKEQSPNWKGGKYISSDGYLMIYTKERTSKSGWDCYKKEHTLKMEEKIGRNLTKKDRVHHINGNKLDNDIDNLYLCTEPQHRIAHNSLQEIGYSLYNKGFLDFDKSTHKYFVAHEKLRELLESLEEDNQQPSVENSIIVSTKVQRLEDEELTDNSSKSAEHLKKDDDIV